MIMVSIVSNIHVRNQIISHTLCILPLNVPVGTSSCTASFVLLLTDTWLRLSSPFESPNLYILVSSLDEEDATRSDYKLC